MALYDNKHWLLSHIKNSFISSDDTGICELVMLGEDIPRAMTVSTKVDCYPGADQSEEEDDMDTLGQSCDIHSDIDFGVIRPRSNTAQRLEKMDRERKKAAKTKHIKWEKVPFVPGGDIADIFPRKDFRNKKKVCGSSAKQSLLVKQLENCPTVLKNPFLEYAKFDGSAQVGVPTRKYGIFMMMLPPAERNYPLYVVIVASAKVQDLIGLVCWKYTLENGEHMLGDSVDMYGLYIAEDDGEVDWDFPCLDPRETISKFGFGYLALVERKDRDRTTEYHNENREEALVVNVPDHSMKSKVPQQDMEDMQRMNGHMTAMEAPLYQSYRVYIINKVRSKTEIQLGISGEKIEIDPVVPQKVSAKFWSRQKAVSYDMESIAACDLTDVKSGNRATLRLVYHSPSSNSADQATSSNYSAMTNYKHYDFETDQRTAEEIVQKVNNILELTSSIRRQEYLALRESKLQKKRSFHIGPR